MLKRQLVSELTAVSGLCTGNKMSRTTINPVQPAPSQSSDQSIVHLEVGHAKSLSSFRHFRKSSFQGKFSRKVGILSVART